MYNVIVVDMENGYRVVAEFDDRDCALQAYAVAKAMGMEVEFEEK